MKPCIQFVLLIFLLLWLELTTAASEFELAATAYRENNYATALPAFTKLAELGDARAQTVLALMYKYGEGTPEDQKKAFEWYRSAANLDYPPAQFNLGVMFHEGIGTEENSELAIKWYRKAALAGFERANEKLEALNSVPVSSVVQVDPNIPWPKIWNFRLPNSHRNESTVQLTATASYRAQLGAMSTSDAAKALWNQLISYSPGLFANHQMFIESSKNLTQPVFRLQTGPFSNLPEAKSFCQSFHRLSLRTGCLPLLSTQN
jgi:TPR repeat protein